MNPVYSIERVTKNRLVDVQFLYKAAFNKDVGIPFLTNKFSYLYELPYAFKGYVYRRMMDWIKVMPDHELETKMTSSLSKSFNVFF